MMLFSSNVLFEFNFFMTSIIYFFIMTVKQCIDIEYVVSKISLKSAENEIEKNSLIKNHVLFSKNVVSFSSTFFCMFLISVSIFDNSFETWFLILIHLIKHHNFFLFATLYQFFFEILKFLFCVWSFVCSCLCESKFFNFFILWISEYSTQFFHFFNRFVAFIASIGVELIVCLFSWDYSFHHSLQSFFQRQRESVDFSDVL